MKNLIFPALFLLFNSAAAQSVNGTITLSGQSSAALSLNSNRITDLYAEFRKNRYPVVFTFSGSDLKKTGDSREEARFVFITTVKKDGRVISSLRRPAFPFFPGDMFMPVETFDFIPVLSDLQEKNTLKPGTLPAGKYEILLEAAPDGIKGSIRPFRITFSL